MITGEALLSCLFFSVFCVFVLFYRRAPQVAADSDEPVAALYYEHEDGLWVRD